MSVQDFATECHGSREGFAKALPGVVVLIAVALVFWPRDAAADPCEAQLPTQAGAEFAGVVRYVGDGDSLCIGPAEGGGASWIEVRLMDFNAPEIREPGGPEARAALQRIALGRQARCVVTRSARNGRTHSFDRTHAICRVDGRTLGELMREAGIQEGGN